MHACMYVCLPVCLSATLLCMLLYVTTLYANRKYPHHRDKPLLTLYSVPLQQPGPHAPPRAYLQR